jgi:hypothetical protein
MSRVPTQPDNERRKRVVSLPPGTPEPEMDADGNIVGTEDYGGTPLRPEIDANGNIVGTGGPVGKFPPSAGKSIAGLIQRLKNWRLNDLQQWMMGMARGELRRPDQKAEISWVNKYVQSIIDLFPESRRGRPQQYEDGADRARAFRKRKSEAKSAEKLTQEILKAYDQNRDSRGRSRREIRSGGRSVMDLPEFNDSPVLGPDNNSIGPAVGGSFFKDPLAKDGKGGVIGSRRQNTFDPDKPSRSEGDVDELAENELESLRDLFRYAPVAGSRRLRCLPLYRILLRRIVDGDVLLAFAADVFLTVFFAILGATFGVLTVRAVFCVSGNYGVCRDQDIFRNHVLLHGSSRPHGSKLLYQAATEHSATTV